MNHGNGIKDRDDKSSGIEILMTEDFTNTNPTETLMLVKETVRRKRNLPDSSGISSVKDDTLTVRMEE
jgi:hypothetical protein